MWPKESSQGTLKGKGWAWGPTVMITWLPALPSPGPGRGRGHHTGSVTQQAESDLFRMRVQSRMAPVCCAPAYTPPPQSPWESCSDANFELHADVQWASCRDHGTTLPRACQDPPTPMWAGVEESNGCRRWCCTVPWSWVLPLHAAPWLLQGPPMRAQPGPVGLGPQGERDPPRVR